MGANRKSDLTWVEKELLTSSAWFATTNNEKKIYLILLLKRQYSGSKKKKVGPFHKTIATPVILNDGKIQFTYTEAKEKYGISSERFRAGIKGLVEKGFIIIKRPGTPQLKIPSLYGFSDQWWNYGTTNFKPQKLSKNIWGHKPKGFQGKRFNCSTNEQPKKRRGAGNTL